MEIHSSLIEKNAIILRVSVQKWFKRNIHFRNLQRDWKIFVGENLFYIGLAKMKSI
jgi:hypothetical protein